MSTILHRLAGWANSEPDKKAQVYKVNGKWKPITARDYCNRVYWLALFLESKGVTSQDIGTIFAYNSPEWVHMDLAAILLGGKSAGIYPNSTAKDILYILNHTETKFLSVQNKEYFKKIVGENGTLAALPNTIEFIIVFDGDTSISPQAISYKSALAEGKKLAAIKGAKSLNDYLDRLNPDAPAILIYTSGTTGTPKGALISNDNLIYAIDCVIQHWKLPLGQGTLFSFLPLCHIAETFQNIAAGITQQYTVYFCTQFENVSTELPEAEPTLLLCVPRLWEKMMEGVLKKIDQSTGLKKQLAVWALSVGARTSSGRFYGAPYGVSDRLQWEIADRLVLSKIRKALGLGKAEALASGAAALPAHVCQWFRSIGLEILEDFGQTESTAIVCLTGRGVDCAGTVGGPIDGIKVKIAEDGEVLTRGRHVFKGYFKNEEATAEVLKDGWLYTGDLGEMDPRGMIRIRGRKKEILKTSGGKMVAPLPIEEALKVSPIISQVCMVGDGRKFLSALITLSESKLAELKNGNGSSQSTLQETLITSPQIINEVRTYIDQVNASLASYEQIKKFAVLTKEFSIAAGEMTPTLKMKRNVIENKYHEVIEQFYA